MSLRPVKRVVDAKPTLEGAGVKLHRAFGFGQTRDFDPFLLFDDFRNESPEDFLKGFPWHPHRGIETITYVLAGTVEHGDSLGNRGSLGAGDVQWMTAGSGIMHQEMPQGDPQGRMHGFQLWANLPSSLKMTRPRYQDIKAGEIPEIVDDDGTAVRVVVGNFWGKTGPVEGVAADPNYIDVWVPPGKKKTLPVETTPPRLRLRLRGLGHLPRRLASLRRADREERCGRQRAAGPRNGGQPLDGVVRLRRRGYRAGWRRRHPLPAGFRQAAEGAGRLVRSDRDEHAGRIAAGGARPADGQLHKGVGVAMSNAGKTVLVTGANRGIGREACRLLKAAGFSVILTARDAGDGRTAADELGVAFHRLDVTSKEDIAALAEDLRRQARTLHALVNNAARVARRLRRHGRPRRRLPSISSVPST